MHSSARLPGLTELTGVQLEWFSDYYDGPITGLARHQGRAGWFVMVTDDGGEYWDFDPRIYLLHELTAEQQAQEWLAHRSFAALDMGGCLHVPPCPVTDRGGDLDALRRRWPPENEDAYESAPVVGWFRYERVPTA